MAQQLLFVPAIASEYAPPLGARNALAAGNFNPGNDDQQSPCGGRPALANAAALVVTWQ